VITINPTPCLTEMTSYYTISNSSFTSSYAPSTTMTEYSLGPPARATSIDSVTQTHVSPQFPANPHSALGAYYQEVNRVSSSPVLGRSGSRETLGTVRKQPVSTRNPTALPQSSGPPPYSAASIPVQRFDPPEEREAKSSHRKSASSQVLLDRDDRSVVPSSYRPPHQPQMRQRSVESLHDQHGSRRPSVPPPSFPQPVRQPSHLSLRSTATGSHDRNRAPDSDRLNPNGPKTNPTPISENPSSFGNGKIDHGFAGNPTSNFQPTLSTGSASVQTRQSSFVPSNEALRGTRDSNDGQIVKKKCFCF